GSALQRARRDRTTLVAATPRRASGSCSLTRCVAIDACLAVEHGCRARRAVHLARIPVGPPQIRGFNQDRQARTLSAMIRGLAHRGETSDMQTIRIAIVEDQSDIREGLRLLIDDAPALRCVGAFGSFE